MTPARHFAIARPTDSGIRDCPSAAPECRRSYLAKESTLGVSQPNCQPLGRVHGPIAHWLTSCHFAAAQLITLVPLVIQPRSGHGHAHCRVSLTTRHLVPSDTRQTTFRRKCRLRLNPAQFLPGTDSHRYGTPPPVYGVCRPATDSNSAPDCRLKRTHPEMGSVAAAALSIVWTAAVAPGHAGQTELVAALACAGELR